MGRKRTVYFLQNGPRLASAKELAAYNEQSVGYTRIESWNVPPDTLVVFIEPVVLNDGERFLGRTAEERIVAFLSHESLHITLRMNQMDSTRADGKDFIDWVMASQYLRFRTISSDGLTSDQMPRVLT